MTEQPAAPMNVPAADPTNPYLMVNLPALLSTDVVDTPDGQRLVLTIRTVAGESTVFLTRDDANVWANQIKKDAGRISPLTVAPASALAQLDIASKGQRP